MVISDVLFHDRTDFDDLRQAAQFGVFVEVKLFHSSDDGSSVECGIQIGYSHGWLDRGSAGSRNCKGKPQGERTSTFRQLAASLVRQKT
jgi:hypothetical protein